MDISAKRVAVEFLHETGLLASFLDYINIMHLGAVNKKTNEEYATSWIRFWMLPSCPCRAAAMLLLALDKGRQRHAKAIAGGVVGVDAMLRQKGSTPNGLSKAIEVGSLGVLWAFLRRGGGAVLHEKFGPHDATLLHHVASKKWSLDLVRGIIRMGGNDVVMAMDSHGQTPLHVALKEGGHEKIIDAMIRAGGPRVILAESNRKINTLHALFNRKDADRIATKLLRICGVELLNKRNDVHPDAFICAIRCEKWSLANAIIDFGGRITALKKSRLGVSALCYAVQSQNLQLTKKILHFGGSDVLSPEHFGGFNPLYIAVELCDVNMASFLVKNGGTHLLFLQENGMNAIHMATVYGFRKMVLMLLKVGGLALAKTRNAMGASPLFLALRECHVEIAGDIFNIVKNDLRDLDRTKSGMTILHAALRLGCVHMTKNILKYTHREFLFLQSIDGSTALHFAAEFGNLSIILEILSCGGRALALIQNQSGETALHVAIRFGATDIFHSLVLCGGRKLISIVDKNGQSPLQVALLSKNNTTIEAYYFSIGKKK